MPLRLLSALDTAKVQYYHFKAIIVAGMGLFTDAYALFCIPPILKLLSRVYYEDGVPNDSRYKIPAQVNSSMVCVPLLGTAIGKLVFGRLGDRLGRRSVYGVALMIMVLASFGSGFSFCTTKTCVLGSIGFFRFVLGIGIGGDYPLSATIMAEFANTRTRGAFMAAVFSMQGFGILASSAVTMVVCKISEKVSPNPEVNRTPHEADIAWRVILILGAVPAALTYYWRMLMPETARYTALVENNILQAAKNMEKVLNVPLTQIAEDSPLPSLPQSYRLFSRKFFRRHGRDLFCCAASWFLLDIVFYSSTLFQSLIYKQYLNLEHTNVYEAAFRTARFQAIVAICSTIPGYWFSVYFIDRIGRRKIQIMGFLLMGIVYLAIGVPYSYWVKHDQKNTGFLVLYGLTFFFANFGPNTTTFIVPAELFPARFRSTCHGISGATGKLGALIGSLGFSWALQANDNDPPKVERTTAALIILGGVCLVGMIISCMIMTETNGRSLEENENDNEETELCLFRRLTSPCSTGRSSNS